MLIHDEGISLLVAFSCNIIHMHDCSRFKLDKTASYWNYRLVHP